MIIRKIIPQLNILYRLINENAIDIIRKLFFSPISKKKKYSHYVGYICLLDDVDVCLSIYTINHSINRERKKRGRDECDIPYRHTTNIYV
jgi:hypothetical protein